MKISTTAYSIGYGTDFNKKCGGLTPDEEAAVKNGELVFYLDKKRSGGTFGHYLRAAYINTWGFKRLVATPDEVAEYIKQTGHDPK